MSSYTELKDRIQQIRLEGGEIDRLEIAQDVQSEIMAEMLGSVEDAPSDVLRDVVTAESAVWLGLTFLEGYAVIARPAGTGIHIVYH